MSQFTPTTDCSGSVLRKGLGLQPRWLCRAAQLKILKKVGLSAGYHARIDRRVSSTERR